MVQNKLYKSIQYTSILLENFRISIENKYTLKSTIAIDKLFTLLWITSINQFPCK